MMIPKVRTWKVRNKDTNETVFVDTINKRFARWAAQDLGVWGQNVVISVVK